MFASPLKFPSNHDAEKAIIACMLLENHLFHEYPGLRPEMFHYVTPRECYKSMMDGIFDVSVMVNNRKIDGTLDLCGGPGSFAECQSYDPGMMNKVPLYAQEVMQHYASREAMKAAIKILEVCQETTDIGEIQKAACQPGEIVLDVLTGNKPEKSNKEVCEEINQSIVASLRGESTTGMLVSLDEFNDMFGGLRKGETIVISGWPGTGKSTLAAQLAMDAALDGAPTLYLTMEMSQYALTQRLVSYCGGFDVLMATDAKKYAETNYPDLEKPTLKNGDLLKIKNGNIRLNSSPMKIIPAHGSSIRDLESHIRKDFRKRKTAIVVVDYAQRIIAAPDQRKDSEERVYARACETLSNLARELDFCLIILSQLNDSGQAKGARAIDEVADLHLKLTQKRSADNDDKLNTGIFVWKSRNTGYQNYRINLRVNGKYSCFSRMTDQDIAEAMEFGASTKKGRAK